MPEHEEGNLKSNLGISRRDLLRRGAVVGGTVLWATPVIQSLGSKAFAGAQPASPDVHGCCFCYDGSGGPETATRSFCTADHFDGANASEENCKAFCGSSSRTGGAFQKFTWGASPNACDCINAQDPGPSGCSENCVDASGSTQS